MSPSARAVIFDIQRFSIHDGPGIRTTVFFKGCPLRCAWCQNPESMRADPEIAFYAERCRHCMACRSACPRGAVLDGPCRRVDDVRCDACGSCAATCPAQALRLIGAPWDPEVLAGELARDADYFSDSGGGVTFSGGEPMAQPEAARALARALHAAGIRVAVETCGMFRWADMEKALPDIDLVYFDVKLLDAVRHRQWTGADNRVILDNLTRLSRCSVPLQARMPVIPGVNDDEDNLRAVGRFLAERGLSTLHCLPYNGLGAAKIPRLYTTQRPLPIPGDARQSVNAATTILSQEGIHAVIYD